MRKGDLKGLRVGPGGMNCPCCFPPPGSRVRKKEIRKVRRKVKKEEIRVGMQESYHG